MPQRFQFALTKEGNEVPRGSFTQWVCIKMANFPNNYSAKKVHPTGKLNGEILSALSKNV